MVRWPCVFALALSILSGPAAGAEGRFAHDLRQDLAAVDPASLAARPALATSDPLPARLPKPLTLHRTFSDEELHSIGCLVGGTIGTGAAVAAGGVDVVNIIAGGVVPVSNPLALGIAMAGVVFASFCAVGQALTPAAIMLYDRAVGAESGRVARPERAAEGGVPAPPVVPLVFGR